MKSEKMHSTDQKLLFICLVSTLLFYKVHSVNCVPSKKERRGVGGTTNQGDPGLGCLYHLCH